MTFTAPRSIRFAIHGAVVHTLEDATINDGLVIESTPDGRVNWLLLLDEELLRITAVQQYDFARIAHVTVEQFFYPRSVLDLSVKTESTWQSQTSYLESAQLVLSVAKDQITVTSQEPERPAEAILTFAASVRAFLAEASF